MCLKTSDTLWLTSLAYNIYCLQTKTKRNKGHFAHEKYYSSLSPPLSLSLSLPLDVGVVCTWPTRTDTLIGDSVSSNVTNMRG